MTNTEKSRIRRERYPERVRAYLNEWRSANKDKVKEYNRRYNERRKAKQKVGDAENGV